MLVIELTAEDTIFREAVVSTTLAEDGTFSNWSSSRKRPTSRWLSETDGAPALAFGSYRQRYEARQSNRQETA
jgi:hypothetical protein